MAKVHSQSAWAEEEEKKAIPLPLPTPVVGEGNACAKEPVANEAAEPELWPQIAGDAAKAAEPEPPVQQKQNVPPVQMPQRREDGSLTPRTSGKSLFNITIERSSSETIGLNLDVTDGKSLLIVDVTPGAIQAWNDTHPKEMRLQVYDRIVQANGATGDADKLLTALKQKTTWQLVIQRPIELRVSVARDGTSSLGMDLRYAPNGTSLMISQVDDGPMKDWNERTQGPKVTSSDRIIEVNGKKGSSRDLLESGRESDKMDMVILHYE